MPVPPLHGSCGDSERRRRSGVGWNTSPLSGHLNWIREKREWPRAALASLAPRGYYVFEDLPVDHHYTLDFFTVGPTGLCSILTCNVEGRVTRSPETDELLVDDEVSEEDLDVTLFEATMRAGARILTYADEVPEEFCLAGTICFTHAELAIGDQTHLPYFAGGVMDLAEAVVNATVHDLRSAADDPREELSVPEALGPGPVSRLAEIIGREFGRRPMFRPPSSPAREDALEDE
jgi:hypothetical protein